MPVTARLSRAFYEKLGDEVASELVEWFNMVDATHRLDLKQQNELIFARADARLVELRAEMRVGFERYDGRLEQRTAELRAEMQAGFARFDAAIGQRLARLETQLTRRLFGFWIAQAATTAGLVFAVVRWAG